MRQPKVPVFVTVRVAVPVVVPKLVEVHTIVPPDVPVRDPVPVPVPVPVPEWVSVTEDVSAYTIVQPSVAESVPVLVFVEAVGAVQ